MDARYDTQHGALGRRKRNLVGRPSNYGCLVVSNHSERRQRLMQSACAGGWETIVCTDMRHALWEARRSAFHLAIVDLGAADNPTPVNSHELCEMLSTTGDYLMMVCGQQSDASEEIWARKLGVWAYLPGVDPGADISLLCTEALGVARATA